MRRTILAGTVVAGAVGLGLVTTPVLANAFSSPTALATSAPTAPAAGWGAGRGPMAADDTTQTHAPGRGMRGGGGPGAGDTVGDCPCTDTSTYPSGTLTDAQKAALAGIAEEEKLAHDVYVVLADSTGDARFTRIAASESRHLEAVRAMLERYGIADPTAGRPDGSFASDEVRKLYDELVAEGTASLTAALGVGQKIEKLDIADLDKAAAGLDAPDVAAVYAHLKAGSERHLAAFGG